MKIYFSILLVLFFITVHSQDKEYTYYMNDDMQIVPKESAIIVGKGSKRASRFLMKYYAVNSNQPFLIEYYTDSTLSILNGSRSAFHANGKQLEQSFYQNNKQHGPLLRWDSLGRMTDSAMFYEDMPTYMIRYRYATDNGRNTLYEFDNTPAKKWPDEKSIVITSSGGVVPTDMWKNLTYSGKYAFRQDKVDPNKYLIYKFSDEFFYNMVANDPKPKESDFFTTGESYNINDEDINGNKLRSKELKGKILVINYWFINCKPCRMEMPELNELVKDYKDSANVKFIGIALDDEASIKQFLKLSPFNYQIVANGRLNTEKYGVRAFPTHVIVDGDGKVYFHTVSSPRQLFYWMRKTINELLEKQQTSTQM